MGIESGLESGIEKEEIEENETPFASLQKAQKGREQLDNLGEAIKGSAEIEIARRFVLKYPEKPLADSIYSEMEEATITANSKQSPETLQSSLDESKHRNTFGEAAVRHIKEELTPEEFEELTRGL